MLFAAIKNYEERMYLAPLNADRFFKKVFSDLDTAGRTVLQVVRHCGNIKK